MKDSEVTHPMKVPSFFRLEHENETLHSQLYTTSNRPKLGIDFGLHLLILATFDPSSNILRVGFHERPP